MVPEFGPCGRIRVAWGGWWRRWGSVCVGGGAGLRDRLVEYQVRPSGERPTQKKPRQSKAACVCDGLVGLGPGDAWLREGAHAGPLGQPGPGPAAGAGAGVQGERELHGAHCGPGASRRLRAFAGRGPRRPGCWRAAAPCAQASQPVRVSCGRRSSRGPAPTLDPRSCNGWRGPVPLSRRVSPAVPVLESPLRRADSERAEPLTAAPGTGTQPAW